MKLSYNYLRSLLPVDLSPEKTAEILTECGLEVEGIEKFESVKGGLAGLVVGYVVEKTKHPDADRLSCTKVDIGGQVLEIVCGAPNVEAGQKVIVAPVGTELYPTEGEPFTIKKSKIRGQLSEGMICAEDEVGLGKSHDGIKVLPPDLPVGSAVADYFKVSVDYVIEINITPNRPDAASHLGAARDIIARLGLTEPGLKLNIPSVAEFSPESEVMPIQVSIEDTSACKRYSGIYMTDVSVGESPEWLKNFLLAVGLRPINNVVDITNFVLMETGQPLHAFDVDAIKGGQIRIAHCAEGTPFVSLDGVERKLSAEDLMICNAEDPMCMAGIFGGSDSGVSLSTTRIFLESARFEPSGIRRSGKRHGLKTDSSFRFERGTDPEGTIFAAKRAALLIQEICSAKIASGVLDIYPEPFEARNIILRKSVLQRVTGLEIAENDVVQILTGLGCNVNINDAGDYAVFVPLFKTDVTREIDLVEEVIRIYGYDKVPLRGMVSYTQPEVKGENSRHASYARLANHLASIGFREILTNSLVNSRFTEILGLNPADDVRVINPISAELDVMRQSLLGSGLHVVATNLNHKNADLKLFEFGKTYKLSGVKDGAITYAYTENEVLAFWVTGNQTPESWMQGAAPADLYTLKSVFESITAKLGINESFHSVTIEDAAFSVLFGIQTGSKKEIGKIGKLKASVLKAFDIKAEVFYAEINPELLFAWSAEKKVRFKDIPKFPQVRRDLALLLDKSVQYGDLESAARKAERNLLKEVNLFDVYEGKNLPEGKKSYALSFILRDEEKTLTDDIIDGVMKRIVDTYEKQFGASLRQ